MFSWQQSFKLQSSGTLPPLLTIPGFLHLIWKTFTVRQLKIPSAVLALVPNEEKSAPARSLGENMQETL